MKRSTTSEKALVLAPRGRDTAVAVGILRETGVEASACTSLLDLIAQLEQGAGFVIVTEEALATADLAPLAAWIADQEQWSDLPFVLLTSHGGGLERNPAAARYLEVLGNITFLERPFHPTTLMSIARSALRGRRRQYEARARLEALRESEEFNRRILQSSADCIKVLDLDGCVEFMSEGGMCVMEVDDFAAIQGACWPEFWPGEGKAKALAAIGEAQGGGRGRFQGFAATLKGTPKWWDVIVTAINGPQGQAEKLLAISRDVTEQKRAEEKLRELNENLEQRITERTAERNLLAVIVETTDAFIQVADLDYRWLAINKAAADEFERIFGVRPKIGDSMLDMLADQPEHRAAVQAVWSRALAGEEFTIVEEFGNPNRDRRFYEIRFNTLRNGEGERVGAFQIVTDVTERLRNQKQLSDAQEALRQAQKMEAVGQLTGGVAHDFNNLLTIIKSSINLMRNPGLSEERRRRYMDAISETVDRGAKLTGQLLAFARRQPLKPEVFDAAAKLHAITDMLRTVVGGRIRIVAEIAVEDCFVEADVAQFETALVNIAANARDAMDGEGRLTIGLDVVPAMPSIRGQAGGLGSYVAVSLADTGSGIEPSKLGQIFEPFFTTKAVGKGTGLGLSQVYGFVKQSGGDVAVQSEVGRGTCFTLYLPCVEKTVSKTNDPDDGKRVHQIETAAGRRILVVEDNVDVGTFSTQLLRDLGYDTAWAANADEALRMLAEKNDFDAVFTDVVMPGISGVELGQTIRRLYPELPVVLTSGYSHILAEDGRHGFELLQKPYAVEDLSRVLRRAAPVRSRKK